jgi:hypothetical protein
MKRLTLTAVASSLVLAIAPASALASHHGKRHHHKRVHHARVIRKRFGDLNNPTTPTTTPTSDSAGTIESFTNGVLIIKLNDNSTVSGKVTNDTEIECEAADNETTMHADGDGGGGDRSGSGDQSGGENNSGDDDGAGENENENENENAQNCSTSLTGGTMVRGAELKISSAGAVWDKVDLIG